MGNFDDFDLDLKKVAEADKNDSAYGITEIFTEVLTHISIKHCGDPSNAVTPTTGASAVCCVKNGASPRCV